MFLISAMIPRDGTVLPIRFSYLPLFKQKKTLIGKNWQSKLKARRMYLAFITPINALAKTLFIVKQPALSPRK